MRNPANIDNNIPNLTSHLKIIILIAIIMRLAVALLMGDRVEVLPGIYDQVSYHALVTRLLSGHGLTFPTTWWPITRPGEPTAHWSYAYVGYLTAIYAVAGFHPLVARLLQALLAGILTPWLAWRIGRRLAGSAAGLVTAAVVACYLYFVYYAAALMTETFYIIAILWAIDLTLDLAQEPRQRRGWLFLGLALAVAVLLRQLILILVPLWLLWLFLRIRRQSPPPLALAAPAWRSWLTGSLLTVAVIAGLIFPFTIRNYLAFHRFVLLNTNSGYAFFWGNHPIYGDHFVPILTPDMPSYQDLIPPELRSLDEAALDSALMVRGIGFVLADPGRIMRLSISRIPAYFIFWPSSDSGLISNIVRTVSYGLLLPLTLLGIGMWWRRTPGNFLAHLLEDGGLLLILSLVYTLIHLLSWALIRYRLPVDAMLAPFASLPLVSLAERWELATVLSSMTVRIQKQFTSRS